MDAIDNVWWRETTLLYTARSDADPIMQSCLAATSVTALSLAFDCAEQGSELAPELRDRLDGLLATAFASGTDPDRRRLMAGVLLTRHLRQIIRTGNGGRVCAHPITTGLYELYRQDTQGLVPGHRIHSESDEPIAGVSGSDAKDFVHWVNTVTGSDTVYRLPNLAEIKDPALSRVFTAPKPGAPPYSVWLEPDNEHGQSELWIPAGADHPHLIDAATLVIHVKDDFERSTTTLTRLLLLRSLITVHVFTHARNRDRDREAASGLARDLDSDLALALGREVDRDLDLARAVVDLALGRDLDRDLARTLDTRDRDRTLDRDLDLARSLDRDLLPDFDSVRVIASDRGRERLHVLEGVCARVMGSALAKTLTSALHLHTPTANWPAQFAQKFADETGITEARYIVSPDTLVDKVQSGQQNLVNLLGPLNGAQSLPWAHQVAINLRETALPIFTRQQPLTADTVTAIRLAALCLAAEADTQEANHLGDTFREIAAGATLLERRATELAIPTETIMLAVT